MTAPAPTRPPLAGGSELPPPTGVLRRAFKHPLLMHYNRLAALVWAVNLAVLWSALAGGPGGLAGPGGGEGMSARGVSYAALANFALAVVVRQQYVINALFWLATRAPTHWPLRVRWTLAKVYHFGGLHLGGTTAGTAWFLALLPLLATEGAPGDVLAVSAALAALLLTMVVTALPPLRARRHDLFERVHRFGGWSVLLLFWVQTALLRGGAVWAAPEGWVLGLVTLSVALPWLRLRKVDVAIERPSAHVALARFDHGVTPFAGSSTTISRNPLLEWHSFANVPSPGRSGFRLTISRAGDWTASFIDDAPARVWVKGITTAGVANIETLFTKVVYVATGSGIGPCLPHLLACQVPARLVWATRTPELTYGEGLVAEIRAVQPDAVIWDTTEHGKPDLVALAYAAYRDFGAEAVICISNKRTTWRVVQGMERRGIPAYGAIWDS